MIRALALAAALLASPALARADGLGSCDEDHDGQNDGCQENENGTTTCTCKSTHSDSGRVAGSLGILGVVTFALARRRRK